MRKLCSAVLMLCISINASMHGQSIIRTAESKSGILLGTQNVADFAGITYERSTEEFLFNYRFNRQRSWNDIDITYPNYRGFNIELGYDMTKGTSGMVGNDKWQGGMHLGLTYSNTWDHTLRSDVVARSESRTI